MFFNERDLLRGQRSSRFLGMERVKKPFRVDDLRAKSADGKNGAVAHGVEERTNFVAALHEIVRHGATIDRVDRTPASVEKRPVFIAQFPNVANFTVDSGDLEASCKLLEFAKRRAVEKIDDRDAGTRFLRDSPRTKARERRNPTVE